MTNSNNNKEVNKEDIDNKNEGKEKEEDSEKKKNKKVFVVIGVAVGVVIIIIILIILLYTFCRRGLPETAGTTETTEIALESEEELATETSEEISITEETSAETEETIEETTATEETTAETEVTTAETNAIAPTINLVIHLGPVYSSADNVCYYRVRANVTGTPTPRIVWSRDDSGGAWGRDIAQVNLHSPTETYTLTATATNSAGSANASITLSWGCNRPPEIQWIDPLEGFYTGLNYAINAFATDPDGDRLTYQWNISCGTFSVADPYIGRMVWTTPTSPCTCTLTLTVNDGRGGTDTQIETVQVTTPNRPPVLGEIEITGKMATPPYYTNEEYRISVPASDPDGDTLSFSWSVTGGNIPNPTVNPATWNTPSSSGYYTITVTVNDGRGGTASRSKTVYVTSLG